MIIFYSFFFFWTHSSIPFYKVEQEKNIRIHAHALLCLSNDAPCEICLQKYFHFFSKVAYHFCVIQVHVNCYEPQTFFFLHHISVMIVNLTFPLFFSPFFSSNSMMLMILISRNIFHASLKISFSPFFQFLFSKKDP